MIRLHVEGFGSHMGGFEWFVAGPFRRTKKQAKEDIREIKKLLAEANETKKQRDELLAVFDLVIDELDNRKFSNGIDAPGHCHKIQGVWDSDNGDSAGKPCGWCATWNKAKEIRAAIASAKGSAK